MFVQESEAGQRLVDWIYQNGGIVQPRLAVVENAPSGSRGVVCLEDMDEEYLQASPMILVPEAIYLTSQVARVGFEYYEQQGAPTIQDLDKATQLAILVAHEKVR